MGSLENREIYIIERIFGMEQGYVLNFSDKSFRDFFYDILEIDINDQKYCSSGNSKANRLRQFLRNENDQYILKILQSLWDHKEFCNIEYNHYKEKINEDFQRIISRLESNIRNISTEAIDKFKQNETLEELVSGIDRDITANKPASALDRLHTYCMKKFSHLLNQCGIQCDRLDPLHSRVGKFIKHIESNHPINPISIRILKSSISIFDEFNRIRNEKSLAHDNEIINKDEARFIFESICAILNFTKSIESGFQQK